MRRLAVSTSATVLLLGLGAATFTVPTAGVAQVSIGVSVGFGPPALPIYDQPPIPGYGYLWTPGFWGWDKGFGDYYWIPGAWVRPPRIGYLWTPGYWGWNSGAFMFNQGYWGSNVGFYGGINYGYGYSGDGYGGGYWQGNRLYYNRAVANLGRARLSTVYSRPMADRRGLSNASYAGGPGGVQARPTNAQLAAQHERHIAATATQARQASLARTITANRAGVNHGKPAIAATRTAGVVKGPGVVGAKAAEVYHRPANAPPAAARPAHAAHVTAAARPSTHGAQARPAQAARGSSEHGPSQHAPPQRMAPQHAPPQRMATQHAPAARAEPPRMANHGPSMGSQGGGSMGHGPGAAPNREPGPQGRPGGGERHEPPHN